MTVEGIITLVTLSQYEKALSPIILMLLANVITHGLDRHNEQQPVVLLQTTVPTCVGETDGTVVGTGVGLPTKYVGDLVGNIVGLHAPIVVVGSAL